MLATLVTAVVNGLRGELVRVEVDVAPGLPVCHIVGLPDAALSEARERVRGALRNSGFDYHRVVDVVGCGREHTCRVPPSIIRRHEGSERQAPGRDCVV